MINFIKVNFFLNNWGFIVSYVVLQAKVVNHSMDIFFGDSVPFYLHDINGKFWPVVLMCTTVFPICLFRNYSNLRYIHLLGIFFLLYEVLIIVIEPFTGKECNLSENFK